MSRPSCFGYLPFRTRLSASISVISSPKILLMLPRLISSTIKTYGFHCDSGFKPFTFRLRQGTAGRFQTSHHLYTFTVGGFQICVETIEERVDRELFEDSSSALIPRNHSPSDPRPAGCLRQSPRKNRLMERDERYLFFTHQLVEFLLTRGVVTRKGGVNRYSQNVQWFGMSCPVHRAVPQKV